jgi:hypothetical protein
MLILPTKSFKRDILHIFNLCQIVAMTYAGISVKFYTQSFCMLWKQ